MNWGENEYYLMIILVVLLRLLHRPRRRCVFLNVLCLPPWDGGCLLGGTLLGVNNFTAEAEAGPAEAGAESALSEAPQYRVNICVK